MPKLLVSFVADMSLSSSPLLLSSAVAMIRNATVFLVRSDSPWMIASAPLVSCVVAFLALERSEIEGCACRCKENSAPWSEMHNPPQLQAHDLRKSCKSHMVRNENYWPNPVNFLAAAEQQTKVTELNVAHSDKAVVAF